MCFLRHQLVTLALARAPRAVDLRIGDHRGGKAIAIGDRSRGKALDPPKDAPCRDQGRMIELALAQLILARKALARRLTRRQRDGFLFSDAANRVGEAAPGALADAEHAALFEGERSQRTGVSCG